MHSLGYCEINYLLEFVAEDELLFAIVENMIVCMVHKIFALVLGVLASFKKLEMTSAFKDSYYQFGAFIYCIALAINTAC